MYPAGSLEKRSAQRGGHGRAQAQRLRDGRDGNKLSCAISLQTGCAGGSGKAKLVSPVLSLPEHRIGPSHSEHPQKSLQRRSLTRLEHESHLLRLLLADCHRGRWPAAQLAVIRHRSIHFCNLLPLFRELVSMLPRVFMWVPARVPRCGSRPCADRCKCVFGFVAQDSTRKQSRILSFKKQGFSSLHENGRILFALCKT